MIHITVTVSARGGYRWHTTFFCEFARHHFCRNPAKDRIRQAHNSSPWPRVSLADKVRGLSAVIPPLLDRSVRPDPCALTLSVDLDVEVRIFLHLHPARIAYISADTAHIAPFPACALPR